MRMLLLFLLALPLAAQVNIGPGTVILGSVGSGGSPTYTGVTLYPAQCNLPNAPSYCSGTTPDAWIRAACSALPPGGGIIDMAGLTGNLAATTRGCSTPTRLVHFIQDLSTHGLNVTENDGDTTFPLDNGSTFGSPYGVGQCQDGGGINISNGANITGVVGPAHTDTTQENFAVQGSCITGNPNATVTTGLVYGKNTYANTTFSGNNLFECNVACLSVQNGSDIYIFDNWLNVTNGSTTSIASALVLIGAGNGTGCNMGPVTVHDNQIEHALGGANYPEINIHGDGAGSQVCSVTLQNNGIERNTGGTPSINGLQMTDCVNCVVNGLSESGSTGGTNFISINQTASNRSGNITIASIYGGGSYTNILNDSTPGGVTLTQAAHPTIALTFSQPGYLYTFPGGGGFTNPMTRLGDMIIGGTAGAPTSLAGPIAVQPSFLQSVGSGSTAGSPSWQTSTGSGPVALQTSPQFVTPYIDNATGVSVSLTGPEVGIFGFGTAVPTAGSTTVIGTGGSYVAPAGALHVVSDNISGTFTFTTGASISAAGVIFTVALPGVRINYPSCSGNLSGGTSAWGEWISTANSSGTVTLSFGSNVQLANNTPYTFYMGVCGGK